ncbi:site-specific integrase [Clostridia bacterium]|nr:site-specific integrase [Clostridia bacterium]
MTKVVQLFPNGAPSAPNTKERAKPKGQRKGRDLKQVTKSYGRKPDGKRDTKIFYGRTLKEACEKRDAYTREREMGALLIDPEITLDNWSARWMELYKSNLQHGNKQNYTANVDRLKDFVIGGFRLGGMRMQDIREAHLQNALDVLAGKSTSLIDKYTMVIQQIFTKARKNKVIHDDPSEDLIKPEGTEGTHRALERWEAECILSNYHVHRCGLWAMIGMLAGLRPGELYALKWSDVDLVNRIIHVHNASERIGNRRKDKDQTKTIAGMRDLPICDPLLEALQRVPESCRKGCVAVSATGEPLTESAAGRGWDGFLLAMTRVLRGEAVVQQGRRWKPKTDAQKAADAALPRMNFRPHDLRHTFATALYDAGVDVKSAQYYLGHADVQMTIALYTHLSKEKEKQSRATLVGFLDSWLKSPSSSSENAAQNADS